MGSQFVPGRMASIALVTKDMATITDNGTKEGQNVDNLARRKKKYSSDGLTTTSVCLDDENLSSVCTISDCNDDSLFSLLRKNRIAQDVSNEFTLI